MFFYKVLYIYHSTSVGDVNTSTIFLRQMYSFQYSFSAGIKSPIIIPKYPVKQSISDDDFFIFNLLPPFPGVKNNDLGLFFFFDFIV